MQFPYVTASYAPGCHCEEYNDEAIPIIRTWEIASLRSQ
jgi:hypothetical protein